MELSMDLLFLYRATDKPRIRINGSIENGPLFLDSLKDGNNEAF